MKAQPCGFSLGADTLLCHGEQLVLQAPANVFGVTWNTGATTAQITVNATGTYSCTVIFDQSVTDVVQNGDFTLGNTLFSSDYVLGDGGTYGLLSDEGEFAVVTSPALAHVNFSPFGDHTSGTGNMLVVNGASLPGQNVWCQTVTVEPDMDYAFSAWLATAYPTSPAELVFSVNGITIGDPLQGTSITGQWLNFYSLWNSGNTTTATICIQNQNISIAGNDFCLDDISFSALCTASDTIEVEVLPPVVPDFTADPLEGCAGLNVHFTSSDTGSYTWSFGDGNSSTAPDPEHVYSTAGTYDVLFALVDTNGCSGDTLRADYITVHPDPVVDILAEPASGCAPVQVTLTNGTPAAQGQVQDWDLGNGSSSNASTVVAQYDTAGAYTVELQVVSLHGCEGDDTLVIEVHPVPRTTFVSVPDSGCAPLRVEFTNTTPSDFDGTCSWDFGDGHTSDLCDPVHTFDVPGTYTAGLRLISAEGCTFDTVFPGTFTVFADPIAAFTMDPQPASMEEPLVHFTDASLGNVVQWDWEFGSVGELGTSTEQQPSLVLPFIGAYPVRLIVTTANGCTDTAYALAVMREDPDLFVPNGFTPDGDGVNEIWQPIVNASAFSHYEVRVFDRWGEEIWSSMDPEQGWTGEVNGTPAQDGVYSWRLDVEESASAQARRLFGHVTLLR